MSPRRRRTQERGPVTGGIRLRHDGPSTYVAPADPVQSYDSSRRDFLALSVASPAAPVAAGADAEWSQG
jgi:hypothetical protein